MSQVFWDTNLFIYLIEATPPFDLKVKQILKIMQQKELELVTSVLSVCEALVLPTKKQNIEMITAYKQLFAQMEIIPIQFEMAEIFATLRAQSPLKTPDALQIACARQSGIQIFITNDERLTQYSTEEMTIFSLDMFLSAYSAEQ